MQREKRCLVADVFDGRVNRLCECDPLEVFGDVRGIDDDHEVFRIVPVDEQIVNNGSVRISDRRILRLPVTSFEASLVVTY